MAKNTIHSIQQRLLAISIAKEIKHQQTLTLYFIERFLYRLSISPYKNQFILKGGMFLYAKTENLNRPTNDMDLSVQEFGIQQDELHKIFATICSLEYENDGILFDPNTIQVNELEKEDKYSGWRILINATLGNIKERVQIDIGFGDIITPSYEEISLPTLLDNLEIPILNGYTIETVIAEKFQAMIDLAEFNSRTKDFYDIYKILLTEKYNKNTLASAIKNTFKKCNTIYQENHIFFSTNFNPSQINWNSFLTKNKLDEKISFEEVVEFIRQNLKPFYEKLKE
jgi:predicted nucleotidyltransferase component of viral defense system